MATPKAGGPQLFMCQNCSALYTLDQLDPIDDIEERVAPGEVMPYGQCPDPDCAAVCHPPASSDFESSHAAATL